MTRFTAEITDAMIELTREPIHRRDLGREYKTEKCIFQERYVRREKEGDRKEEILKRGDKERDRREKGKKVQNVQLILKIPNY
jgi:hypothetical protein